MTTDTKQEKKTTEKKSPFQKTTAILDKVATEDLPSLVEQIQNYSTERLDKLAEEKQREVDGLKNQSAKIKRIEG